MALPEAPDHRDPDPGPDLAPSLAPDPDPGPDLDLRQGVPRVPDPPKADPEVGPGRGVPGPDLGPGPDLARGVRPARPKVAADLAVDRVAEGRAPIQTNKKQEKEVHLSAASVIHLLYYI